MEKTRVKKGEIYWSIRISGEIIAPSGYVETNTQVDSCNFSAGNYFRTEKEAEIMARKIRAILKGADVVEMPSEKESVKEMKNQNMVLIAEFGWTACFNWLKSKIVK